MSVAYAARRHRAAILVFALVTAAGFASSASAAASIFGPGPDQNDAVAQILSGATGPGQGQGGETAFNRPGVAGPVDVTLSLPTSTPFSNPLPTAASGQSDLQAPGGADLKVSVSGASLLPVGGQPQTETIEGLAKITDMVTVQAGQGFQDGDTVTLHETLSLSGSVAPYLSFLRSNASLLSGEIDLTVGSSTGAIGGVAGDTTQNVGGISFGGDFDPFFTLSGSPAPSTLEFTQDLVVGQATQVVLGLQLLETLNGDSVFAAEDGAIGGTESGAAFELKFDGTGFLTGPGQTPAPALRIASASGFNFLANDTQAGGVPEPQSWALMVLGFGGLGALLRGRRRTAAA